MCFKICTFTSYLVNGTCVGLDSVSSRGRPYMTSRKFWHFLTPPPPIVTLFITEAFVLLSQYPRAPSPKVRDVIYVRPQPTSANKPMHIVEHKRCYIYQQNRAQLFQSKELEVISNCYAVSQLHQHKSTGAKPEVDKQWFRSLSFVTKVLYLNGKENKWF